MWWQSQKQWVEECGEIRGLVAKIGMDYGTDIPIAKLGMEIMAGDEQTTVP
jgi:hypothetical protein